MLPMHQNKDKDLVLYISLYFEKKTFQSEKKKNYAIKQYVLFNQLWWRNCDNVLNFFPFNEYLWNKSEFWQYV